MSQHTQKHTCPMCDSSRLEVRHDRKAKYKYLRQTHILDGQEHTVCLECGTSYFQAGQIERNNRRFAEFARGLVKHIAPWEIVKLREKYLLSQETACRIFQCGSVTQFSKWERGEVAPTGTAAITLREALDNPVFMKKLADRIGERIDVPVDPIPAQITIDPGTKQRHVWTPDRVSSRTSGDSRAVVDLMADSLLEWGSGVAPRRSLGLYVVPQEYIGKMEMLPDIPEGWFVAGPKRPLLPTSTPVKRASSRLPKKAAA